MNRKQFLQLVAVYIESDPEAAAHVADYVQAGLNKALNQAYLRAADMEAALAMTLGGKQPNSATREKIKKWMGKASLNWDWICG